MTYDAERHTTGLRGECATCGGRGTIAQAHAPGLVERVPCEDCAAQGDGARSGDEALLTRADVERLAGTRLDDEAWHEVRRCVEHSSIPEALGEVVFAVMGDAALAPH